MPSSAAAACSSTSPKVGSASPPEKLHFAPWPVDLSFWSPQPAPGSDAIAAVGMEGRDYPTLLEAVRGLPVQLELAIGTVVFSAGSVNDAAPGSDPAPFERLKRTFAYRFLQENREALGGGALRAEDVTVHQQLTPIQLRDLYARSRFVVVPLHDVDSDCGITTITEAMAMGKAVIVSKTRGQVDVIEDGKQGLYVPPADPQALRAAVEHLLANPEEAARMGRAGRALAESRHSLDDHVERIGKLLGQVDRPVSASGATE